MEIIFWVAIGFVFYTYLGYPVITYFLSYFYKKPLIGKYIFPTVSLLIYAGNDRQFLEQCLQSVSELDYPDERIEVIIGFDRAGVIDLQFIQEKIKLAGIKCKVASYHLPGLVVKPVCYNKLFEASKNEILIFSEALNKLDRNSIKELVKYFADPKVGSVSGELSYDIDCNSGIKVYWKYEKFIRKSESRLGSMLGAGKSLYAMRRELFEAFPESIKLCELYAPLKVIDKGYRAIYDKKARVYVQTLSAPETEYLNKVENAIGNYQLFIYFAKFFNPFKGKISWQFFSHKFLRLIVPFLLVIVLVSNIFIVKTSLFYAIFFLLQLVFYFLAVLGRSVKIESKLLDVPHMFCVMNAAAVVGLYRFLHDKQQATWEKAG